jgi:hypothetical protein
MRMLMVTIMIVIVIVIMVMIVAAVMFVFISLFIDGKSYLVHMIVFMMMAVTGAAGISSC